VESRSNGWNDASTKFYSVDSMLSSVPNLQFRSSIMTIIGRVMLTLEGAIGVSFIVYGLSAILNQSWRPNSSACEAHRWRIGDYLHR
jgi:hypothetical protein